MSLISNSGNETYRNVSVYACKHTHTQTDLVIRCYFSISSTGTNTVAHTDEAKIFSRTRFKSRSCSNLIAMLLSVFCHFITVIIMSECACVCLSVFFFALLLSSLFRCVRCARYDLILILFLFDLLCIASLAYDREIYSNWNYVRATTDLRKFKINGGVFFVGRCFLANGIYWQQNDITISFRSYWVTVSPR